MKAFLPLPFTLHGVREELSERPFGPLQQLIVQQEGVGRLCHSHKDHTKMIRKYSFIIVHNILIGRFLILFKLFTFKNNI